MLGIGFWVLEGKEAKLVIIHFVEGKKKSTEPLESKMRQISIGINLSCSNCPCVQIIPEFYNVVYFMRTSLIHEVHVKKKCKKPWNNQRVDNASDCLTRVTIL